VKVECSVSVLPILGRSELMFDLIGHVQQQPVLLTRTGLKGWWMARSHTWLNKASHGR